MASENPSSALNYHEATKHSELSVRTSRHYLDWENKPSPFKRYKKLPPTPLPQDFPHPREVSLRAIRATPPNTTATRINVGILAEILFFSAGLTRRMKMNDDFHYMRAAPATGALYPIELYVISGNLPGLKPGVYHFNPLYFTLVKLRDGDYRAEVAAASTEETLTSPVILAFTSLAWRNAWKYEARSYRHWFWDSGVIAANLLATTSSEGLATKLITGFFDSQVNQLLGLAPKKEATVALALIGVGLDRHAEHARKEIAQLDLEVEPLSKEELDHPIIWKTNEASQLHNLAEVNVWRQSLTSGPTKTPHKEPTFRLRALKEENSIPSLEEVILRRGSTRRFAQQPISFEHLSTIINASSAEVPLDFLPHKETLTDFYLIANEVGGLPSGSYFFNRETDSLEQLKAGEFRHMSGYLCLEQSLFSDASAVFFLMTDLQHALNSLGDRGYRAAQFEAGIRAGKIYLSSYSLWIGASGSTFYDDAVTDFFSPHAKGKSTMIAVGIGVPAYRARIGRILPQMTSPAANG